MAVMICRIAVVALVFLAGCPGFRSEGKVRHVSDGKIRQVSKSLNSKIVWGHPARYFLTVEFTMPEEFRVSQLGDTTLIDTAGRSHPMTEGSLSETNGIQRVRVTFEIAQDPSGVIRMEEFDVDLGTGEVKRHSAAA